MILNIDEYCLLLTFSNSVFALFSLSLSFYIRFFSFFIWFRKSASPTVNRRRRNYEIQEEEEQEEEQGEEGGRGGGGGEDNQREMLHSSHRKITTVPDCSSAC